MLASGLSLLLLFLNSGNDVIDPQQHAGGLDGGLEGLQLDSQGLPDALFLHVGHDALVAVDAVV